MIQRGWQNLSLKSVVRSKVTLSGSRAVVSSSVNICRQPCFPAFSLMAKICPQCLNNYMLENRSLFTEETIDFSFSVVKVASSDGAAVTRQSSGEWLPPGWWAGSFMALPNALPICCARELEQGGIYHIILHSSCKQKKEKLSMKEKEL